MAQIRIGTSGWHYGSWRGPFFPEELPIKAQLQYYASQFDSVELNGVFSDPDGTGRQGLAG